MSKRRISEVDATSVEKKPRLEDNDEIDYHALVVGHIVLDYRPADSVFDRIRIEKLVLTGLNICDIPDWVYSIHSLKHISIRDCKKVRLRPSRHSINALESLKIKNSTVKRISAHFGSHPTLKKLSIHNCILDPLDDDFFTCESVLDTLEISQCDWIKLPSSLSNLQHLKKLHLERVPLDVFPSQIFKIGSLEILNLCTMYFTRIPPLSELKALRELSFEDCFQLKIKSSNLGVMNSIECLDVRGIQYFGDDTGLLHMQNLKIVY